MIKTLRPYQQTIVDEIKKRLKESDEPILVDASVGSGKSLIIAEILLMIERANFRALCLTLNSTLIKQNADTYNLQGGNAGIYCSGLNAKEVNNSVIFASPHSVVQGIRNKQDISRQPFQLIVIDECHNISPHDSNSMYMRILSHYSMLAQEQQYKFKIIGLTGTPYRSKSVSIVGEDQLFKSKACEISMSWLIDNGYLVRPSFGLTETESFDFSQLRINSMGKFDQKQLQDIVTKSERLTGKIMRELTSIVNNGRTGAFIFASTRKHCIECLKSLPEDEAAVITGETSHDKRKEILDLAKSGIIRYLINVNVLTVGIDIPNFDVCAWLRPTESLVLYTQGIGRILRLHPNKSSCLVLDYAGNIERHGDIDDPIINEALKPKTNEDPDYCIPCYDCNTLNRVTARRCIGVHNDKRCLHYFDFKPCHKCETENDIVARHCRKCDAELVDPNQKLKQKSKVIQVPIGKAEYWLTAQRGGFPIINCRYYHTDKNLNFTEIFYTNTEKSKNLLYAKFIRHHIKNPSYYYMVMNDYRAMENMLQNDVKTPHLINVIINDDGTFKLIKKIFDLSKRPD
jgi:DNA repair protein RadD